MRVELLFPPLFKMDAPYTALPYLAAFLRANGVEDVRLTDLNIAYLHHLLAPSTLVQIQHALSRRHATAAGAGDLGEPSLDAVERSQLAHATGLVSWLIAHLPNTLDLFARHRSAEHVASLPADQALEEQTRIQLVFDLVAEVYSTYFFPWRIENLLTRREVHFSNDSWPGDAVNNIPWREQLAALDDPRNPFRDWAQTEVMPGLEARAPDVIGLSLMFREQFLCVFTLAEQIRDRLPGTHICLGGALLSDFEHYLLSSTTFRERVFEYADSIVIGPGEVPLFRLLERLRAGLPIADIPNVLTRANTAKPPKTYRVVPSAPDGRVRRPGAADRFQPLPIVAAGAAALSAGDISNRTTFVPGGREDAALVRHATPDYFGGDMDRYLYRESEVIIPYLASHGCYWNKCVFCKYRDQVSRYTPVPLDRIMGDFRQLITTCSSRRFHLNDEALSPSFCRSFSRRVLDEGLDIRWSGNSRFDPGLTRDVLAQVRASGCEYLSFGLESASENVLALTAKGTRLDVVERTMRDCREVGLPVCLYLFFGFPGETRADLLETMDFLRRHQGTYVDMSVGPFTLYHSTEVFQEPERFGIRIQHGEQQDPELLRWTYDYEVDIDGALQRDEAARLYLEEHQRLFGEVGLCFSTDGSL